MYATVTLSTCWSLLAPCPHTCTRRLLPVVMHRTVSNYASASGLMVFQVRYSCLPPRPPLQPCSHSPSLCQLHFQKEPPKPPAESEVPTLPPELATVKRHENSPTLSPPLVGTPLDGTDTVAGSTVSGNCASDSMGGGAGGGAGGRSSASSLTVKTSATTSVDHHDGGGGADSLPGATVTSASVTEPYFAGLTAAGNAQQQKTGVAAVGPGETGGVSSAGASGKPHPTAGARTGVRFGGSEGRRAHEKAPDGGGSGARGGIGGEIIGGSSGCGVVEEEGSDFPISPSGIRAILKGFSLLPWQLQLDRHGNKMASFASRKQQQQQQHGGLTKERSRASDPCACAGDVKEEEMSENAPVGAGDRVRSEGLGALGRPGPVGDPAAHRGRLSGGRFTSRVSGEVLILRTRGAHAFPTYDAILYTIILLLC